MRISLPSIVLGAVTFVSLLACSGVDGGTAGVSGFYTSGDCNNYGDTCMGQAPVDGAFELMVLPVDAQVVSVTLSVTYQDAAGDNGDITSEVTTYEEYDGQYWMWSPSVPPEGYVEVSGYVTYDNGVEADLFCPDNPIADWAAYVNVEYEVDSDDHYSSSTGCYLKVNLRDVVE